VSRTLSSTYSRFGATDLDRVVATQTVDRLGVMIAVEGDIDLATAPRLARHLRQALCLPIDRVTVDLSDVDFMDSQGLHVLNDARLAAGARGVELVLLSPSCSVRRLLEVTASTELFEVCIR
jgi:anti-sigma B factor antagonist